MLYAAEARKYSLEQRDTHLKNEINSAIRKGETSIYYPTRLLPESKREFMKSLGYEIARTGTVHQGNVCLRISW